MSLPTYILGDVHGEFNHLNRVIETNYIQNCNIICVGDLGIGFKYNKEGEMKGCSLLNEFFQERNIQFYSIRGNHDDPKYFSGPDQVSLSNFKLLSDYHTQEINGKKFLFVGGAISVDRRYRIPNQSWWEDEVFVLKPELVQECDVLITHSAPTWIGPTDKLSLQAWIDKDPTLWDECLAERREHDKLVELAKPKRLFCGHFHQDDYRDKDGCIAIIIDILQFKELH